ncbi:cell division protein FtsA [Novosphingobium sp. PC22D]|uniref:cell division protein FtsA n=1 Tax=Novosphingobium sp. PC22D TaxID=1962403 RepID=UPI000BF1CA3A|nr:cell division protein FtsA [Novosphingobium sp. PC22D]PEQ12645.1 cell division protein FtsA [Novosphingobium sp. PC22D]
MPAPRIVRVVGAVNLGSFRISAIVAGITELGDMVVLGSGHRASAGIKRGYVTNMAAATHAVRDAIDRAERMANQSVQSVWVGCAGAGLASQVVEVDTEMNGRRIEQDDIDQLLVCARDAIRPDGRMVLHAQPAQYRLDGAHGVADPCGLHAERLGVNIHVMLADGAPIRNLTEAVQNAHLEVEAVVASPIAAGHACLSPEERDLGVALVEFGAEVTNVAVYAQGLLRGMIAIPRGSSDITDAIASVFGIRRSQAERLKCVSGSALASPHDHREMIPVNAPGEEDAGPIARHADEKNRIPRAELIGVITTQLGLLMEDVGKALKELRSQEQRGKQVVFTGGGAELVGLADFAQAALGRPVRIGTTPHLTGLAEAHVKPGFATLAGLVLYAAHDPIDIRRLGARHQTAIRPGRSVVSRVFQALKEYF